ncbi:hypothetical protein ABMY35_18865 [Pseudoalteromonas sp. BZB3]|uniref:hypothetical protein n=1 Tax=Pseudoalteromonas sp. BZB3 TaxID=3136670 RepID=UPI0032C3FC69
MKLFVKSYKKLIEKIKQFSWYSLAMLIVVVFAGPEIFVAMELTLMLEVMGASTFCMFYLSAIKAFFEPYLKKLKPYFERFAQFEGHSFFVLKYKQYKQMPSMLMHAVPANTLLLGYLSIITGFAILTKIV